MLTTFHSTVRPVHGEEVSCITKLKKGMWEQQTAIVACVAVRIVEIKFFMYNRPNARSLF